MAKKVTPPPLEKPERFAAVTVAVLGILQNHGEDHVSHTRVSRDSGISRSWLYKYVGNSRESLLNLSIDYFGKLFTDHGPAQTELGREQWMKVIVERFERMLELTMRFPGVPRIYFRYRGRPGAVGRWLEETASQIRNREAAELRTIFGLPKVEAERVSETLSALRMGLMFGVSPVQLPDFAMNRNMRDMPKKEVLELFERILRAVITK